MKPFIIAALLITLSGCSLPQTTVRTGSPNASLVVTGAPVGAVLYVDGIASGSATQFDGNPNTLAVLEGVHQVEIRKGTEILYHDKIFVGSGETHAITLLPVAGQ